MAKCLCCGRSFDVVSDDGLCMGCFKKALQASSPVRVLVVGDPDELEGLGA